MRGETHPLRAPVFTTRRPNPVFSEPYRHLRETIIAARKAAGLSQRQLAAHLGKSASHVARIECGQRRVDALELCLIAKVFGIDPGELIDSIARAVAASANEQERSS